MSEKVPISDNCAAAKQPIIASSAAACSASQAMSLAFDQKQTVTGASRVIEEYLLQEALRP
jgi:hypothetical protein